MKWRYLLTWLYAIQNSAYFALVYIVDYLSYSTL